MKTLARYHVCNHCLIGDKTFKNELTGPDKLPGLSRNGPQGGIHLATRKVSMLPFDHRIFIFNALSRSPLLWIFIKRS